MPSMKTKFGIAQKQNLLYLIKAQKTRWFVQSRRRGSQLRHWGSDINSLSVLTTSSTISYKNEKWQQWMKHFCAENLITLAANLEHSARKSANADFQPMTHHISSSFKSVLGLLIPGAKWGSIPSQEFIYFWKMNKIEQNKTKIGMQLCFLCRFLLRKSWSVGVLGGLIRRKNTQIRFNFDPWCHHPFREMTSLLQNPLIIV